jgi:hypothetical protein
MRRLVKHKSKESWMNSWRFRLLLGVIFSFHAVFFQLAPQ